MTADFQPNKDVKVLKKRYHRELEALPVRPTPGAEDKISVYFCIEAADKDRLEKIQTLAAKFNGDVFVSPHHMKAHKNSKVEVVMSHGNRAAFIEDLNEGLKPSEQFCPQSVW